MQYTIRHLTRFTYEVPVTESVTEARMQPRSDATQRCLQFGLSTAPASHVMMYQDHDGNMVHHFDIPGPHSELTIIAEAMVECDAPARLPDSLGPDAWRRLDATVDTGEAWEYLTPSRFARPSAPLDRLAGELTLDRSGDPLRLVRRLCNEMYRRFEYSPSSTRVDSPIDEALEARRGVCQDLAHIFIALARAVRIPCRYVSGYLFHDRDGSADRSSDGATHAWVEVLLPDLGWVGFDPTNNREAGDRHIRVAIGRDYADVPPTRGVFKGVSAVRSELAVAVQVGPVQPVLAGEPLPFIPWMSRTAAGPIHDESPSGQQQ